MREHKTSLHALAKIIRTEGIFAVYNGYVHMCIILLIIIIIIIISLSAGLLRQATYSTTRLGVFQMLMDNYTK